MFPKADPKNAGTHSSNSFFSLSERLGRLRQCSSDKCPNVFVFLLSLRSLALLTFTGTIQFFAKIWTVFGTIVSRLEALGPT